LQNWMGHRDIHSTMVAVNAQTSPQYEAPFRVWQFQPGQRLGIFLNPTW
jgi:hypothetical protein